MALTLRLARREESDAVAALFTASRALLAFLPPLHTAEEDRGFIRDHVFATCRVTLAEDEAGLAGYMADAPGWIEQLYVAPERLRGGVGSALVADAKSRNAALELWCFADNLRGRAFYERHGFVPVEFTDGAGNESSAADIRYRWTR